MSILEKREPSRPPSMDASQLAKPIAAYAAHLADLPKFDKIGLNPAGFGGAERVRSMG